MDMSDKDKSDIEKRNANPMNYHPPNIPSDWRFNGTSPTNPPISLLPTSNHPVALGSSSSCSSAPLVDSFTHNIWDHSTNSQHMGFCEMDMQNNANTSNVMRMTKGGPVTLGSSIDRPFDMGWNPPSTMLKPGNFLSNPPGMFAQSLSQFPTDSAFIERAARFSSFSGGNFSDIVNSFGISEPVGLFPRSGAMMQGPHDMFGSQSRKNEMNVGEGSKDASFSLEHGPVATDGSLLKNNRKNESLVRPSHEEAKRGVSGSGNESDEAEFSGGGGGGQDEPIMMEGTSEGPSNKGFTPKKRKRNGRDAEIDQGKGAQAPSEAAKENNENQLKGEQNPSPSNKSGGKQGKQGSPNSDPPKEEYIHVRARRGQATNSHSLAERVRREKISERMKFLQDLVPGCSKVTGKAVMLDEIINYVQSLQRQVEFLSMKLATVNPRLDFNIEGLLGKDILQSRAGPSSSTLGFTPDMGMAFPALLPSQTGLMPATLPTMLTPSDILRRAISSQLTPPVSGGMKEHAQVSNAWDDELHNVVQMSYGSNAPPDSQDANGSLPPGPSKVEL